jgi:hypothetical protein
MAIAIIAMIAIAATVMGQSNNMSKQQAHDARPGQSNTDREGNGYCDRNIRLPFSADERTDFSSLRKTQLKQ